MNDPFWGNVKLEATPLTEEPQFCEAHLKGFGEHKDLFFRMPYFLVSCASDEPVSVST